MPRKPAAEKKLTADERHELELLRAQKAQRDLMAGAVDAVAGMMPDQPSVARGGSAGEKVIIGCRIGVPWLDLQVCEKVEEWENTPSGPRKIVLWRRRSDGLIRIRGTAYPRGTPPVGYPEKPMMVSGAALTFNVSKEMWDAYCDQRKDQATGKFMDPMLASGQIFAFTDIASVRAHAKELKSDDTVIASGLDSLMPDKDPRIPRSTNSGVSKVETEEDRAAKMAQATAE